MNKKKNVIMAILTGLMVVLLIVVSLFSCSKQASAETVDYSTGYYYKLKPTILYSYTEEIESLEGFIGMSNPTYNNSVKFLLYNAPTYLKMSNDSQFTFKIELATVSTMYVYIYFYYASFDDIMSAYVYTYSKRLINGVNYWVITNIVTDDMPITSAYYAVEQSAVLSYGFIFAENNPVKTTVDSESRQGKQFSIFFDKISLPVEYDLKEIGNKAYNTGYEMGLNDGYNKGLQDGAFGTFTSSDVQNSYNTGYAQGRADSQSEAVASTSWFLSIFTALSSIFSIRIFGDITLGLICLIPFALSFVWFILRSFRGGGS